MNNPTISTFDIIELVAKNREVERIIYNITHEYIDDLSQDIYEQMLTKDIDKIEGLYMRGELNKYICKIVCNNIKSVTSRYYYLYKKPLIYARIEELDI